MTELERLQLLAIDQCTGFREATFHGLAHAHGEHAPSRAV
jgi:hypothetical protein